MRAMSRSRKVADMVYKKQRAVRPIPNCPKTKSPSGGFLALSPRPRPAGSRIVPVSVFWCTGIFPSMIEPLKLWRNARIATCDASMTRFVAGALLSRGPRIEWVGAEGDLPPNCLPDESHDLHGAWVTPGLIDCHTHLVFAGTRAAEYAQRLRGRSYQEIARAGGGILSTM